MLSVRELWFPTFPFYYIGLFSQRTYLLDDVQLTEAFRQFLYGDVYLFFGVRGHKGYTYQRVLRSASGRDDGVDEDAFIESQLGDSEGLFGVAHVEGDDG